MKHYNILPVTFDNVIIQDHFWKNKLEINRKVTLPSVFKKCETEGRIDNFTKAAGLMAGSFIGEMPFDDTDVYKAIEGASYSLVQDYDKILDDYLNSLIELIGKAQESDGYLYTNRTIDPENVHPFSGKTRWSSLLQSHELYNCGHLYEAAYAHNLATGKKTLLDIAIKNANLICSIFKEGGKKDIPGHQIIEMGLVKLYRITRDVKFLDTAKYFLEQRGYYENRKVYTFEENSGYCQDHIPVKEQTEAVGHAVRAVYMYCGMADIAALLGDEDLLKSIDAIWKNITESKIYLTGGIGARHKGEAFGANYELPNLTAYNETCAAIGSVMFNHRLFLLHGNSKYIDVLEHTLYNGLISGISLSGDRYFYPNPLESDGEFEFNYGSTTRQEWFDVSCCPTNLSRFFPSLPGYIYAVRSSDIYINLFMQSTAIISTIHGKCEIQQKTLYPREGNINIIIIPENDGTSYSIRIRIPGWLNDKILGGSLYSVDTNSEYMQSGFKILLNNESCDYGVEQGYIFINRKWNKGDIINYYLPLNVKKIISSPNIVGNRNKAALMRGPIVYCVEEYDSTVPIEDISMVQYDCKVYFSSDMLGGVTVLDFGSFKAIPYYSWSNRGPGKMKVWMNNI